MEQHNYDFYQNLRFRTRKWNTTRNDSAGKWTEYLMFAPDLFHLLCKLSLDNRVPFKERAKLAAAAAYFVSPFDLMPEALLGFVGFADDIALAAYVLNSIINRCNPEIVKTHWAGDRNILELIRKILKWGDGFGRKRIMEKITKLIK